MKLLLIGMLLALTWLVSCKDKKGKVSVTEVKPLGKYDPSMDSSVYTGEMKRYWLVLLKRGPNRKPDSTSAAMIQAGHMAHINKLAAEGKIIMAGPIGAPGDLRGIFIMNCRDSTEVEKSLSSDTAVITGRLVMEYYPWWSEKGKFIFN